MEDSMVWKRKEQCYAFLQHSIRKLTINLLGPFHFQNQIAIRVAIDTNNRFLCTLLHHVRNEGEALWIKTISKLRRVQKDWHQYHEWVNWDNCHEWVCIMQQKNVGSMNSPCLHVSPCPSPRRLGWSCQNDRTSRTSPAPWRPQASWTLESCIDRHVSAACSGCCLCRTWRRQAVCEAARTLRAVVRRRERQCLALHRERHLAQQLRKWKVAFRQKQCNNYESSYDNENWVRNLVWDALWYSLKSSFLVWS